MINKTSEFGRGLCYCLGLFLAHKERITSELKTYENREKTRAYEMWFYSACDHLYELKIPRSPKILRERLSIFKTRCLGLRMVFGDEKRATEEDFDWAIKEALDLLLLIDEKMLKIKPEKSDYE